MYVIDGIAYAGEQTPQIKVCGVKALENYKLRLRFSTGEVRLFDFMPLLSRSAFAPLKSKELFADVYIEYGVPLWLDGDIDISPEFLYENSVSIKETA